VIALLDVVSAFLLAQEDFDSDAPAPDDVFEPSLQQPAQAG
jgi:hypothetical protein